MPMAFAVIFLLQGLGIVAHGRGFASLAVGLLWAAAALAGWAALAHAGLDAGFRTLDAFKAGEAPAWSVRPSIVTVAATLALLAGVASSRSPNRNLHRLAAVLMALGLAMGAMVAIGYVLGERSAFSRGLLAPVGALVDAFDRMAGRADAQGPANEAQWPRDALSYFEDFPALALLALRDARGQAVQAAWMQGPAARPLLFPPPPLPARAWPAAGLGRGTAVTGAVEGGRSLWITVPRPLGGELLALVGVDRFLGEVFPPEVAIGFGVRVHHREEVLFTRAWPERSPGRLALGTRIERQGGDFVVRVMPGQSEYRGLFGLPMLAAMLGTVLAAVIGLLLNAVRANRLRSREVDRLARELAGANERLERSVAERTAQLAASNKELELFAYTVAHDLRAPLRHIVNFGRELAEHAGPALDAEGRRLLEVVTRSAQKQSEFIHELLEYARLGDIAVRDVEVDLASLVEEVVIAYRAEALDPPTQWHVGRMPRVRGDALLLRQALANLVGNAVKFTRKVAAPRIEVEATVNGGAATVTVRDNGAGYDARYAGKLFTPFHRLHHASDFPGSGMGLAIVRRVAERLGGTVRADSRPGEGAAFSLTLRAAP